jgi:hypothetical protein
MFIAAMMVRTKLYRENLKSFYQRVLEMGKSYTKEDLSYLSPLGSDSDEDEDCISLADIEEGLKNFESEHSVSIIDSIIENNPLIASMKWAYLVAPEGKSFISSDNPVSMSSPEREAKYGPKAIGAQAGLAHNDVELIFPITSRIALLAGYKLESDQVYLDIDEEWVDQINYRTLQHADHVIANNKKTLDLLHSRYTKSK